MLGARMASAFRATIEQIGVLIEIGGRTFRRNLVTYQGAWRLYLNTPMRTATGKSVGQGVTLKVEFDPSRRADAALPAEWTGV
jgi:hypothetical protein